MSVAAEASTSASAPPRGIRSLVITGASALGVVSVIERGCSFAAHLLAARVAGVNTFGAYSLALITANNVATYTGAGIGTTANRFAGRYRRGGQGYAQLVRSLALVGFASAFAAILLLLLCASPLARLLLGRPDLTTLLQVAAFSAGMMILLECLRGFLIGERWYGALAVLALGGAAVVIALPIAARAGAMPMLICQAVMSGIAMLACLAFMRRAPVISASVVESEPAVLPSAGAVWRFGIVQFAGVIGLNAAGWWVAALVARADTTLAQAGLLAVASQIRNLTSLAPNLLTQSSYSLLADDDEGGAARCGEVLTYCTYVSALVSMAVGGTLAAVAAWLIPFALGSSYRGATLAVALATATAIVHMTSSPAAARLTIVSLRHTTSINAVWTVVTVVAATWLVPFWGAAAAMGVYLGVHVLAAFLVVAALRHSKAMPAGVTGILFSTIAIATLLGGLAIARAAIPAADLFLSMLMLGVTVAGAGALVGYGFTRRLLPRRIGVDHFRAFFGRKVSGQTA